MGRRTLWIDLTDLFHEFRSARHPTGVSRLALNVADQLIAEPGEAFAQARMLFWRHGRAGPLTVDASKLGSLADFFPRLSVRYQEAGLGRMRHSSSHRVVKSIASCLPRSLRYRLFPADSGVILFERWARSVGVPFERASFAADDCLLLPGCFWLERHAPRLVDLAQVAGASVTAFVHDMIYLTHPEWRADAQADKLRRIYGAILPKCAAIVCFSRQAADDLQRFIGPGLPIGICRIADRPPADAPPETPAGLRGVLAERFVLCVSTLSPRKNQGLLVEAWRELRQSIGGNAPFLVLVGRGEPDFKLAALLEQERAAGGRIVRLGGVDDASLEALYRRAWITAYPSLGEGYGLPVAEALSRGKVCLAGLVEGVREAGAGMIDVIDTGDHASVVERVNYYLADPARLEAREALIRGGYRSTSWAEMARSTRLVLEQGAARSR